MQIFHPSAELLIKVSLIVILITVIAGFATWYNIVIARPHARMEPVEQVVPFSHKHHVGDDGIDCRYCHTSVETSSFAGIPPIKTCMTCHSQLYTNQKVLAPVVQSWEQGKAFHWKRVYDLPDFVYFNHSIHVAKGVGCETCHGRVDRMPLTWRNVSLNMQWCLACHRDPARYIRPRDHIFDMGWHVDNQLALGKQLEYQYHINTTRLTDCLVCHR